MEGSRAGIDFVSYTLVNGSLADFHMKIQNVALGETHMLSSFLRSSFAKLCFRGFFQDPDCPVQRSKPVATGGCRACEICLVQIELRM